jgi:hypothetical protein
MLYIAVCSKPLHGGYLVGWPDMSGSAVALQRLDFGHFSGSARFQRAPVALGPTEVLARPTPEAGRMKQPRWQNPRQFNAAVKLY